MSEKKLTKEILRRHGARPDLRLWRNETGLFWAGRKVATAGKVRVVLSNHSRVMAGLCRGSADLVGIKAVEADGTTFGVFVGLEVKGPNTPVEDHQSRWLEKVSDLGGIAGIVRSIEDADELLGDP